MCGIAGEFRFDGRSVESDALVRMRDTMIHRGPDGAGHFVSSGGELGLAHRRLSIIDLSAAAAQPMSSAEGNVWITFNGEIYNHVELRKELEARGHKEWKTGHSDTEVIIRAYLEWGTECLSKLRGMFAFALWDERKKQLFIARDRMGIKPFYYYLDNKRFLFGSEIKAILAASEIKREINEEALFHYLTFATVPAPQTFYKNIFKIPAAHFALISLDGMQPVQKYWDVWDKVENLENQSEAQIAERLLGELEESVRLHKASDVPVGVFLSGGVDSTVNTILFAKGETQPVNTFTIDYESSLEAHRSEAGYARAIAEKVGANSHVRRLYQADLLQFLSAMGPLQDEPSADPVAMPIYYVSMLSRDSNIKVVQVGEGADELFCGYSSWMRQLRIDDWRRRLGPQFLKETALMGLRWLGKENTFTYETTRRAFSGELQFWAGAEAFTERDKLRLLSPRLKTKFAGRSSQEIVTPIRRRFTEAAPDQSLVQWMAYSDLNIRLPETLLMRIDKMGMGASIESRVPFLDHKFVEFAMSVPSTLKIKNGEPKHILKRAVRGIVPEEVLKRKKQGFSVPLEDWFFIDLGKIMHDELKSFCLETDLLDWTEVQILLGQKKALQCWFLFNIALWWKNWIK